jgi:hypothetical protein
MAVCFFTHSLSDANEKWDRNPMAYPNQKNNLKYEYIKFEEINTPTLCEGRPILVYSKIFYHAQKAL